MVLRPLTCANPVIPGLTSCRLACSAEYNGKKSTNNGLGPINAISPIRTLNNCGNSSIDVERTICPTLVSLFSSGSKFPSSSRSSVIVLNFTTVNILPSFPGLFCVKKIPAPLFAKCSKMAMIIKNHPINSNATSAIIKSRTRLKKCLYIF